MSVEQCPNPTELLAWLQGPLESESDRSIADHIESCSTCQSKLDGLSLSSASAPTTVNVTELVQDLRRTPPDDPLEDEPECVRICEKVASGHTSSPPTLPEDEPDASELAAFLDPSKYEPLGVLGRGGMGMVYRARNVKMNRLVAIKMLPAWRHRAGQAVARFEREMKVVARLNHPNIVTAYDAGETKGRHFLVLELINGIDLKKLVKGQGPLPVAKAVDYVIQAARGLGHAHEQGIVHRDVKPANLMLDKRGMIKILDLGLACILDDDPDRSTLTETGTLIGTADYLAPEQAVGSKHVDARADIYSLGCSLHFLLTGRPPYDGDGAIQKILAHREKPIPSLRSARPDCPLAVEHVFLKMLAKSPDHRYQSMSEVIEALESALASTSAQKSRWRLPAWLRPPWLKR